MNMELSTGAVIKEEETADEVAFAGETSRGDSQDEPTITREAGKEQSWHKKEDEEIHKKILLVIGTRVEKKTRRAGKSSRRNP